MMIQRADIQRTLEAAYGEVSQEQVTRLWDRIVDFWQDETQRLLEGMEAQWVAERGARPDALTLMGLRNQAQQLAEDQARAAYLEPLTEMIVAQQIAEEDEMLELEAEQEYQRKLHDPEAWKDWSQFPTETQTFEMVRRVWEGKPKLWQYLADSLLTQQEMLGKWGPDWERGEDPNDPMFTVFYPMIEQEYQRQVREFEEKVASETGWMDYVMVPPELQDMTVWSMVRELWTGDLPGTFHRLAENLYLHRQYHNLPLPKEPGDQAYQEMSRQVMDVINKREAESRQRDRKIMEEAYRLVGKTPPSSETSTR